MNRLTGRQEQILDYIRDYLAETGFPPTRSEIAQEMGFRSPNAAEEHLRALARKGAIEMLPGTSRGIRLPISEQLGLPIIGQVAAGSPILLRNLLQTTATFPLTCSPPGRLSSAVKGTSMIDVGIYEDDLLAVHKTDQARSGDIVVARVDDEVTVKRLETSRSKHKVTLIAENPDFDPIVVDLRDRAFAIEGISVGVIRRQI